MRPGEERILVPLDGSQLAEAVLPPAAALARCLNATVVLLHIIELRPPETVHGEPHLRDVPGAEAYLTSIAARLEGLPTEIHVHEVGERHVPDSIAEHVSELRSSLVALCVHGRPDLRRAVSGSIAQQVLVRTNVPVLLVHAAHRPRSELKRIVVPLDGTEDGEVTLPLAARVARGCGASLTLVTVVPTLSTLTGDRLASARLTPISTAAALDAGEVASGDYLSRTAESLRASGVQVDVELRRGDTVQMLADVISQSGGELVAMATHGRAGLDALWIGSIASALTARVDCPVLLVRRLNPDD